MKSEKIDVHSFVKQVAEEIGLGEDIIFSLLAESYGVVFNTAVKAMPFSEADQIKYVLVDQNQNKILNNMKLTRPKLDKITDIFKTKCTKIVNQLEIARRMKVLKKTGAYTVGIFESRFGENNLYFIKDLGIYAKIKISDLDILIPEQREKNTILLKLISIDINQKTGKVNAKFSFRDKQNIRQILLPYLHNIHFSVADFREKRVKVRVTSKPTTKFMKNVIEQSGLNIQFVWPKSRAEQ